MIRKKQNPSGLIIQMNNRYFEIIPRIGSIKNINIKNGKIILQIDL
ncbi:MAG: hypothetical protein GXP45_06105 [bacterium]|nr:hypothetical protein [bacterium]